MARYELTEEERDLLLVAVRYQAGSGHFSIAYGTRAARAIKTLESPVPEPRGGMTEEQRNVTEKVLRWILNMPHRARSFQGDRDIIRAALAALNAPAEPCAECVKLENDVDRVCNEYLDNCAEFRREIARLTDQLASERDKSLGNVRWWQRHCEQVSQQLAEAKAEPCRKCTKRKQRDQKFGRALQRALGCAQRLAAAQKKYNARSDLHAKLVLANNEYREQLCAMTAERDGLRATIEVLSDPDNLKQFHKGLADMKAGRMTEADVR